MDDGSGDDWIGWFADGLAAGVLGAAVGASLHLVGQSLPGVGAATVTVLLTLAVLRRVKPEPRRFRLPTFELPVAADPVEEDALELTEEAPEEEEEVLVLEDRLSPPQEDSRVVQLFAARPLPTPGELRQRIEEHLGAGATQRSAAVLDLEVDAAAALRQALGDLRRSLA
ncbi:hypothetical protein [Sphingomonas sp. LHG3406-1]|uniref:hypothetical protein n=1 Tax=Sphingomonas sp. LHG3406-1 TaxID=2804617 RepID=UPI0026345DE5|nr:hypothetical protein [Sphingomonas sp. LHG3406-1]